MSGRSRIEWTEVTWNPTTGCDRISAGCDHCYALTLAKRLKGTGSAKYQNDGDPRTSGPSGVDPLSVQRPGYPVNGPGMGDPAALVSEAGSPAPAPTFSEDETHVRLYAALAQILAGLLTKVGWLTRSGARRARPARPSCSRLSRLHGG
jgi:hypothetical protein